MELFSIRIQRTFQLVSTLYYNFSIYYVKNLCPLPQKSEILYIRKKHYSACLLGNQGIIGLR